MLSPSFWTSSWSEFVRGLMLYGVPTAALVSLCGLAVWKYKHRRQDQLQQVPAVHEPSSVLPAASSGVPETDGVKVSRGGTDHLFSDSGYVESASFISTSTSTPVLPKQLVDDMRSPDGQYPPTSNTQQQQQPAPSIEPTMVPPTYSAAPVDLRIPRSRATIQLPIDVVGRFIGRQGRNIKSLMAESGSQIHVQQKNLSRDASMVPCVLQGTNTQITKAIDLILLRHPEVVIPSVPTVFSQLPPSPINPVATNSSDSVHPIPAVHQLAPETSWDYTLKPHIIPDSPFLAIATYIEKLNRIWLVPYSSTQQLDELHQAMTQAYSKPKNQIHPSSTLPHPPPSSLDSGVSIPTNELPSEDILSKYCAVRVSEIYWLRGRVNATRCDEGTDYEVKLMDYGSSVIVPSVALKPLRKEHTLLSIQAFPCILANVIPINNDNDDGMVVLQALVEGTVLEVHTPGPKVKDTDIAPLVELYVHQYGSEVQAFVNREVVNQGFAVWRESTLAPQVITSSVSAIGSKTEPVVHSKIDQAVHLSEPTSKNTCSLENRILQNDSDSGNVQVVETASNTV